jgi:Siphovirus ReqiPepy6 Gp37-like protein
MELFTLNRKFLRQDAIDGFHSAIWTERYYGDSEVELVVPVTSEMIKKLPPGIFLSLDGSNEVMIIETRNIEDGKMKLTGISILSWMNNRFVRVSAKHEDTYWYIYDANVGVPGWVLWAIIYYMCCAGSPYLNGTVPIGISNPQALVIPGLGLKDYDKSGTPISVAVPFGPVYDAMREIATTYEIGMQITLESATDTSYSLGFRSYKGLNRTSNQSVNPVVRFSPQMDSLADIKELESIAALKTLVYAFASQLDDAVKPLATTPGVASLTGSQYTGFDLRAQQVFASDITTDMIGGNQTNLVNILNSRAKDELTTNRQIKTVDGEIVPMNQFQYGVHYNLGDVIEVQGNSETVQTSRVTEYIRAQDEAGERAYPTVAMLG